MDPDPEPKLFPRPSLNGSHPTLTVEIVRRAGPWPDGDFEPWLIGAAQAAFTAAEAPAEAEAALVLTDDAEIRGLNARWRGQDKATNVLSFPMLEPGALQGPAPVALGDVVLACETVEREARERGLPLSHHAAHLAVHGVLHLLGYDHEDDADARLMQALESRVMTGLGLADPYSEDAPVPPDSLQEPAA